MRTWVVADNKGKCKPMTKANKVRDLSLGCKRERQPLTGTLPVKRVHAEPCPIHLHPSKTLPQALCHCLRVTLVTQGTNQWLLALPDGTKTELWLWLFALLAVCSRDSRVKTYGNPRSAGTFHVLLASTSFKDSHYVVPSQAETAAEIRAQCLTLAAT